jgi:hypothetical protein
MRLSLDKIESICRQRESSIGSMLREAGVSRNAFYSLARKKSVVPRSLIKLADHLGVSISGLLEESHTPSDRMKSLVAETERIAKRHRDVERDNVRHTLILLEQKPIDRLRRALRRGRSFNFR